MYVGERLYQLRKNKKISQRELAKRAGMTNSAISMIETNKVSPSISSLEKVLAALAVPLSSFFDTSQADELDYQVVYKEDDLLDVSHDQVSKQLVGKHFIKERAMCATVQRYPAGAISDVEENAKLAEKTGYLIKGKLVLDIKGKKHSLEVGDSFYFESHLPHKIINHTYTEALMFCVAATAKS